LNLSLVNKAERKYFIFLTNCFCGVPFTIIKSDFTLVPYLRKALSFTGATKRSSIDATHISL
jgi:hypothetical protein